MAIGYPVTKTDLDNTMGRLVLAVRDALYDAANFKTRWLDDSTLGNDTVLTNLGYSSGEITTIRAAFTALNNLNNISHAQGTQASANDFFFDAKKLLGIN